MRVHSFMYALRKLAARDPILAGVAGWGSMASSLEASCPLNGSGAETPKVDRDLAHV